MPDWDSLIEKKIKRAMRKGAFDNLPGKGEPLDLGDENPFADPSSRMAFRLLRNNNVAPPWIEEGKEIGAAVDQLRAELARRAASRREGHKVRRLSARAEEDWRQFQVEFQRQVADLNRRIAAYNLKAPSAAFHRLPLDAQREIERASQGV